MCLSRGVCVCVCVGVCTCVCVFVSRYAPSTVSFRDPAQVTRLEQACTS